VRKIWTGLVVCCLIFCVVPGLVFSQEPAQFESLLASAQDAQARSDFQAAAEFYQKAIAIHPEIAELRTNLGLMYYQTGKDNHAIDAFRQAIRLKPSLFVPNLFLGLDYVKLKRFNEAIPYLKQAVLLNSADMQAPFALGQAYAGEGKTRLATASYSRVVRLNPNNADGWFHLGVSYLEQVEADSRTLLARHRDSGYLQALFADSLAEQHGFLAASTAYKKALALPTLPPDTHAGYGFVLLDLHDFPGAERELNAELAANPGSLMAKLGVARSQIEQGRTAESAKEIEDIWKTDPGFLQANVPRFDAGLPQSKRSELVRVLEEEAGTGTSPELVSLFDDGTGKKAPEVPPGSSTGAAKTGPRSPGDAAALYARGKYGECSELLASRPQGLSSHYLRMLVSCAYATGDYQNAFAASQKLAIKAATEAEGSYWEIRSAQKLATDALTRASELDSTSPKLHVLLGDVYRQQKGYPDAEREYRKALALKAEDPGASFGLCLTLLADSDIEGAFRLAQSALQKNPDDPELNGVMGEILYARHDFSGAEPYLKKGLNTKPELVAHVHALLGRVYAETNRTQDAIAELKLGFADDRDGRLHYQIGRLYLKLGDRDLAKQAFEVSERMRREQLSNAAVAMQHGGDEGESQ
jgi:tetratricopeptide (TPR) repeat protein